MSRWGLFHNADALEKALAQANETIRTLLDRNTELTQQIASMKRDNFDAPIIQKFEPQAPLIPSAVQKAIAQRAAPRSREWAHLEQVALELLEKGNDEESVTADILAGEDPDSL